MDITKCPRDDVTGIYMLLSYVKKGFYSSSVFALSAGLTRCFNFLFLPFFLNHLSITEFGIWDFYQTFFSLSTLLLSSLACTSLTRFYLLYSNDRTKQKQAIGNSLLVTVIGILIFVLIAPFYIKNRNPFIILTVSSVCFFSLFSIILAYLRVTEQLLRYLLFYCSQSFLALILTVIGVKYEYGIEAFFYANLISLLFFVPFFIRLLSQHWTFNWSVLKEQAHYSLPLLIYSILYNFLYCVDRLMLQKYQGYELLGSYSLLSRFGSIFQFLIIALIDASPLIFYSAQNEENSDRLIEKLINYFCIAATTFCITIIGASILGIHLFLPDKFYYLIAYMPFFFLPLLFLEFARILQTGFGLATKTIYVPFLVLITLCLQCSFLYVVRYHSLYGFFFANTGAFIGYCFLSYWLSNKIYQRKILDRNSISKLLFIFSVYILMLHAILLVKMIACAAIICLTWPITCWVFNVITIDEKKWIKNQLFRNNSKQILSLKSILYIRADIHYDEMKAGGSVSHTLGTISGFQKNGCVVTCASSVILPLLRKIDHINVIPLKYYPLFFFLRWKFGYLRWQLECFFSNIVFFFQLRKIIRSKKFDAIYQRYTILSGLGILISKIKGIPFILEYNGSEVWAYKNWSNRRLFNIHWLAQCIEKINLICSDYIIVVSEVLKDELIAKNIDKTKILVNPNGVDPDVFDPERLSRERVEIRNALQIQNKFVFGFVGTFSYWHGIEILEKIIVKLHQNNQNFYFLLIGDGVLKSNIAKVLLSQNIGNEYVLFPGMIDHDQVPRYLAACDAFLCPTLPNNDGSRFFGSPTKIFEYLSMAKPVIASNLEQLTEIMNPSIIINDAYLNEAITNQIGFLVDPNNIEAFIKAIQIVSGLNAEQYNVVGMNARALANKYSWQHNVRNIISFVNN